MGKKAKNATFISGTKAGKISKEIQKVEKRRIIKSTSCNERSSRIHCMVSLNLLLLLKF
ncbi:putative kinesin-like protein [Helianthus debilis subsp. tardiflorus]